ncbi:MAG: rod shape-determining protein MreC [Acidimicrobiales bacterium]
MAAPVRMGRRRVTLGLILLASVTLITLDFQNFGPLGTIQTGAREVLAPLRDGAERIASPITGVWRGATDYDNLEAQNIELRAEIDRLRGELVRGGIDRRDYEELLVQNGLEVPAGYPLILAKVKTAEVGNFSRTIIEIEAGSRDGVENDMAVITAAGLIGRVEQVDRTTSTVRLVSDPDFVIGAEVAGEVGLATGQRSSDSIRIEQGITGNAEIEIGDAVTTTRSERSLFPPNLVIGTVSSVAVVDGGRNTVVTVELSADPTDLRFVSVVLVEPGAEIEEIEAEPGVAR